MYLNNKIYSTKLQRSVIQKYSESAHHTIGQVYIESNIYPGYPYLDIAPTTSSSKFKCIIATLRFEERLFIGNICFIDIHINRIL